MSDFLTYLPPLLSGIMVTLILTVSAAGLGLFLAILMTIASVSDSRLLKKTMDGLGFFFRGTPLLVQIYLIYYGAGQFDWVRESIFWPLLREPMTCAILALAVNSACYTTVILQGAIRSVPANEVAACEAIGMPRWLAFRRIIFPRAFRIALPAYSNEVVMILKASSLASTITLLDIMGVTQQLIAQTYDTLKYYLIAGVLYLCLNAIISIIFSWIFKKYTQPYRTES